jgi:hypothetical protein
MCIKTEAQKTGEQYSLYAAMLRRSNNFFQPLSHTVMISKQKNLVRQNELKHPP